MTEEEWLADASVFPLLQELAARSASDRKLRLFCCACYRSVGHASEMIRAAERYADGRAKAVTLSNTRDRSRLTTGIAFTAEPLASCIHLVLADVNYASEVLSKKARVERVRQVALLRDIFGNPFRPAAFAPEWRTDTAVAIAKQMYESRDFGAMPILADALQDAGCDSETVLSHCRGEGSHVRGCWVVDLVLGKS